MPLSDFRNVVFTQDVHDRADMTLVEASVDTTLRGSERFFLHHIIAPPLDEMLAFCDSDKAKSIYTEHQLESARIWVNKGWFVPGESPEPLREQGLTVFSAADIIDMQFNVVRNGSQFYDIHELRADYFLPVSPPEGAVTRRKAEFRGYSTRYMHYDNKRAMTMFDLGAWYQRSTFAANASSVLTIRHLMRAFLIGRNDNNGVRGYDSVDITLSDSEFNSAYRTLADAVPAEDVYMWMLLCGWRAHHNRNFLARLPDAVAMSKMFSGEDVIHFLRYGETSIKTVKTYYKAGIDFDTALPFFDIGVSGIRGIRTYTNSGIPMESIRSYLSVGVTDIDDIRVAVENEIDPSLMGSLVNA